MDRRRIPYGTVVRTLLALLIVAAAIAVIGCGDDDSTDAGAGPATVTPSDALVYLELCVRPDGEVEEGAVAAARKVLRVADPGAELRRLIDEALADEPGGGSFEDDFEPWLGRSAGLFVLAPEARSDDPPVAFVVAARDRKALAAALDRRRDAGELTAAGDYRGVDYYRAEADQLVAVVGDQLVIATIDALRAVVDVARGGDSLADSERYRDAVDGDDVDEALAFVYADPRTIADAIAAAVPDAPADSRASLDRLRDSDPVVATLTATADEIALEATADEELVETTGRLDSDAETAVGELPGDAWLALTTPPLGPLIEQALTNAGVKRDAAREARQALGLDLDRDLLDPLGGLGLFARGSDPLALGGGALLRLTDATAAERLMTRIRAIVGAGLGVPPRTVELAGGRGFEVAIPQSPQPIVVVQRGDRIAAGYGDSSVRDLLEPRERLGESAAGRAAIATLGDDFEPSFVVIVPPLAQLLSSLDQLQVAELSDVAGYLGAYRSLAVGTRRDDGEITVRVVAALR